MNKYLTILLVLLTATGSEGQTLTSALTVGNGSLKFEEMLTPEQLNALGSDIMSVLKGFQVNAGKYKSASHYLDNNFISARLTAIGNPLEHTQAAICTKPEGCLLHFAESSISIRAPSNA